MKLKIHIVKFRFGEVAELIPDYDAEEYLLGIGIKATVEELKGWRELYPNKAKPKLYRIR